MWKALVNKLNVFIGNLYLRIRKNIIKKGLQMKRKHYTLYLSEIVSLFEKVFLRKEVLRC